MVVWIEPVVGLVAGGVVGLLVCAVMARSGVTSTRRGRNSATGSDVVFDVMSLLVLTQRVQGAGQVGGRQHGGGMIIAQDPAASRESVFIEIAGLLVLTEGMQIGGQIMSTAQRGRVVCAQHPTAPDQRVAVELAGLVMLAQRAQISGEVVSRAQRVGMIVT